MFVQRRMWVKLSAWERVKTVCLKQSPWWQCVCVCMWEFGHSTGNEWVSTASCLFKINLQCQTRSDYWKHIRRWSGTDSGSFYTNANADVFSLSVYKFIVYIICEWCFPLVILKRFRAVCHNRKFFSCDFKQASCFTCLSVVRSFNGSNLLRFWQN